jgi:hypothetical protein
MGSDDWAEVERSTKRQDIEGRVQAWKEGGFSGPIPMDYNDRGVLEPVPGAIEELQVSREMRFKEQELAQRERESLRASQPDYARREKTFNFKQSQLENWVNTHTKEQVFDPTINPVEYQEVEAHNQTLRSQYARSVGEARQELFPEEYPQDVPAPLNSDTNFSTTDAREAISNGDWTPGETFIVDGEKVEVTPNGKLRRVGR